MARLQKLNVLGPHEEEVLDTRYALVNAVKYRDKEFTGVLVGYFDELVEIHTLFIIPLEDVHECVYLLVVFLLPPHEFGPQRVLLLLE